MRHRYLQVSNSPMSSPKAAASCEDDYHKSKLEKLRPQGLQRCEKKTSNSNSNNKS